MKRCLWCHRPGGDLREVVVTTGQRDGADPQRETLVAHPEHEQDLREFVERTHRFSGRFLALVAACLGGALLLEVLVLALNAAFATVGIGLAVVLLGGLLTVFPFATPGTVTAMGARGAARLVRGVGAVLMLAGIVVAALPAL